MEGVGFIKIDLEKLSGLRLLLIVLIPFFGIVFYFLGVDRSGITYLLMAFYLVIMNIIYYTWLWLLERTIGNRAKDTYLRLFYLSMLVIYVTLFSFLFALSLVAMNITLPIEGLEIVFDELKKFQALEIFYGVFNLAIIYEIFFLSKRIVDAEKGRRSGLLDYIKLFLFIYLLPIVNIFFIQRRIKEIG